MLDSAFKVFCQQQPFTPPGFSICERLPFYNPDGCCHNNGEYIFYESESSSNKKTHVGAFLEACQAAKALNASALRLFLCKKRIHRKSQYRNYNIILFHTQHLCGS